MSCSLTDIARAAPFALPMTQGLVHRDDGAQGRAGEDALSREGDWRAVGRLQFERRVRCRRARRLETCTLRVAIRPRAPREDDRR